MTTNRLIALAAIFVVASAAFAQGGGAGGGGGQRGGQGRGGFGQRGGMFQQSEAMLLSRPDVQKDLKLTDDQKKSLQALQKEMGDKMRAEFQGLGRGGNGGNGGSGGNGGNFQEIQQKMEAMQKEANDKAKVVLTEQQWNRLGQIKVQLGGAQSFIQDDLAKKLGLKAQQKIEINHLIEEQQAANQQIAMKFRDQNADRQALMAEMRKNDVTLREEVVKLLTDDQKKTLASLEGPKFEADPNYNGGGFGGGFGGGGRGGNGGGGAGGAGSTGGGAAGTRGGTGGGTGGGL